MTDARREPHPMEDSHGPVLSPDQLAAFHQTGAVVLPSYFTDDECAPFKADMDRLDALRRDGQPVPWVVEFPGLWSLIVHPRTLAMVRQVMQGDFVFHHLHASRQGPGTPGVHWHQDYEQEPQTNRSHLMVHVFHYFNGLNGEVGDLVYLPGSQQAVVANNGLKVLGENTLPGEVVVDNLPPGSAVMVHSALWHCRRKKPGGDNRPRYFADSSFCQSGIQWPSYHNPGWRDMLAAARANLPVGDPRLSVFDDAQFFDAKTARTWWNTRVGSVDTWSGDQPGA